MANPEFVSMSPVTLSKSKMWMLLLRMLAWAEVEIKSMGECMYLTSVAKIKV